MNQESTGPPVEDKKLSPEVEEKLKVMRGFTPKSTFFWTPVIFKENIPREKWPIFKMTSRDGYDYAKSEDDMLYRFVGGNIKTNAGVMRFMILQKHIVGWNKNVVDKDGNPLPFERKDNLTTHETISRLTPELQREALNAINEQSKLSEEEIAGLEF